MRTLALLVSLALIGAGCASEQSSQREVASETPSATTPAPAETAPADLVPAEPAVQTPVSEHEIQLVGALGCGHCTFEVGADCAPAVRTEDGVVHLLEGVDPESELFTERHQEAEVRVVGVPHEEDGIEYLMVSSYEM